MPRRAASAMRRHLPAERLGHFAAALLGHADSRHLLSEMRHGACARRSVAGEAARKGDARRDGEIATGDRARIREREVPEMRRGGAARDRHDGYVRRFILVFLSLHRSAQRQSALRQRNRAALVSDRPVRRRNHACDSASALFAILHQGDARYRTGAHQRARDAAFHAGDGAEGRRGHVEVARKRGRRDRDGRAVWLRHRTALYALRSAAGERSGMERAGD